MGPVRAGDAAVCPRTAPHNIASRHSSWPGLVAHVTYLLAFPARRRAWHRLPPPPPPLPPLHVSDAASHASWRVCTLGTGLTGVDTVVVPASICEYDCDVDVICDLFS